jgi:hypothetical protein
LRRERRWEWRKREKGRRTHSDLAELKSNSMVNSERRSDSGLIDSDRPVWRNVKERDGHTSTMIGTFTRAKRRESVPMMPTSSMIASLALFVPQ